MSMEKTQQFRKLEESAAEILGKESALFVTSGTQGNQVAVLTHCRPGQEILLESESHIFSMNLALLLHSQVFKLEQ